MATIRSFTSLEQSKKLAEILPLDADMCYVWDYERKCYTPELFSFIQNQDNEGVKHIDYPCWSLAALFGILPKFIGDYSKCLYYDVDGCYCGYINDGDFMLTIKETKAGNPIDACVKMIERLHELNLL